MERNFSIDIIKICSCLGVCTLHFYIREMESSGNFRPDFVLFYVATIAIPLFFMVNGYLLMSKTRESSYYINRILNIFKIVFTVNALYYIVIHFIRGQYLINPIKKPLIETFHNLFLQEGVFSIFWFLGALLMAIGMFAQNRQVLLRSVRPSCSRCRISFVTKNDLL